MLLLKAVSYEPLHLKYPKESIDFILISQHRTSPYLQTFVEGSLTLSLIQLQLGKQCRLGANVIRPTTPAAHVSQGASTSPV